MFYIIRFVFSFISSLSVKKARWKMAENKSKVESMREWVVDNKLRTVGKALPDWDDLSIWLHAQALTLAALAGAAVVEYYDRRSSVKADRYAKQYLTMEAYPQKD
ncbi:hypothetical protein QJS04_geneDACA007247 [Acorus gramineus]|uniref:Uncharacterized protein n=1 Tax=Acorus gramineus TaxID=55184 RepID=A0AAV9BNC0_ACOGR|nr:hypothetical protein QJS04_geneDACA007247 [Acorus gramineus]